MVSSYGQLEKRSNGAEKIDVVLNNGKQVQFMIALSMKININIIPIKGFILFLKKIDFTY